MAAETNLFTAERLISSSRRSARELADLATSQHGVVARRQLLELGFSSGQIQRMRAARTLHGVHQGVYAVGHRALRREAHWSAAVLACGPDALLGVRSCAALASIRRTSLSYVEVMVPRQLGRMDQIRTYVCSRLQPQDRDEIDGIPCTSTALTLLSLAAALPRRGVERACDEAEVQQRFDLAAIEACLSASAGAAAQVGCAPSSTSTARP